MLFNSLGFLLLFLPVVYTVFWMLRTKNQRYAWLGVTGYVFYSFFSVRYCALMALSTLVSYAAGRFMERARTPLQRRLCMVIPVTFDLGLLGFFKYADFIRGTSNSLFGTSFPMLDIILPVGISFYTFHTITYIVDCYRGAIQPTRNVMEFISYVSLFPQLVAGPIVRFREIEGDLDNLNSPQRADWKDRGWYFFILGLAKKVCVADTLARWIDPMLLAPETLTLATSWICALGYSYQLYFDFSGYSDMAVGLGYLFGLRLPQNFNSPYRAVSIADFWRRWHISLSSVLRDYLYIPLGGNRGSAVAVFRNLMLTMLLGGLWHGANWTFVIWGGYHGALLWAERASGGLTASLPVWARRGGTFLLVVIGWVFFRATTVTDAWTWLKAMAGRGGQDDGTVIYAVQGLVGLVLAAWLAHFGKNTWEFAHPLSRQATVGLAILFAVCLGVLLAGVPTPFLYFQF